MLQGADALRPALARHGIDYDELFDRGRTVSGYLALFERGFEYESKNASQVDPVRLERLDTLWAAALGTTWLVEAPGATIAYMREALEVGEPVRVARGRALLLTSIEALIDPPGARRRLPEVIAMLDAIDSPMTRAWAALCRGGVTLCSGAHDLGLADLRRAEELLAAPENRGMVRELSVCRTGVGAALLYIEGPAALGPYMLHRMRLADEAGERFGQMQWRCNFGSFLLGPIGVSRARAEIRRGIELADGLGNARMHSVAHIHAACLELVDGAFERAHDLAWQTLGSIHGTHWDALHLRFIRALILMASLSRGYGDREAVVATVERDVATMEAPQTLLGERIEFPIVAGRTQLLRGVLADAAGQRAHALAWTEAAASAVRQGGTVADRHGIDWCLGALIGGARGVELQAQARAGLRSLGFEHPGYLAVWPYRASHRDQPPGRSGTEFTSDP